MFYKLLTLRTIAVILLTWLLIFFLLDQSFITAIITGLITGILSFFISLFLKRPITNAILYKVMLRRQEQNKPFTKRSATGNELIIYAVDFGLAFTLPSIASYLIYKKELVIQYLQTVEDSSLLFSLCFVISFLYLTFIFFIYRKRLYGLYTLLWISVFVCGALNYFSFSLGISESAKGFLLKYATIMGFFCGGTGVLDYLDKNIVEKSPKLKKHWDNFFDFMEWKFLIPKKTELTVDIATTSGIAALKYKGTANRKPKKKKLKKR